MYIYSGKSRQGDCGMQTGYVDLYDKELFVGDIVVIFTEGDDGILQFVGGISVVVSDKYISYSDGTHIIKDGNPEFFVMGIKDAWPEIKDSDNEYNYRWKVVKVKEHSDVVEGEHWKKYGFNYSKN